MQRHLVGRSRSTVVAGVVALSCLASADARAAEPRDVEALIGEGMDLRRQGKDERALPFFQKAYGIEHAPRSAGQLGLAEMAVGYWLSAEAHLAEALDSPGHPWIAKNQATLASALERVRRRIGELTILGAPVGARVVLNGQDVGTLPLAAPIRVGEGRVQVEMSARGYVTASKTLHLAGGDKERVTMTLLAESGKAVAPMAAPLVNAASPAPGAPPAQAPPPDAVTAAPGGAMTVPPRSASEPNSAPPAEGRSMGTAAYVTGGLAVAALAFAIVETVRWQKKETEFANHTGVSMTVPPNTHCGEADPSHGAAGCEQIYKSGVRAWELSLLGYGLTAALGGTALYLYLTADRADKDGTGFAHAAPSSQLRCLPSVALAGAAFAGLDCALRF